MLKAIDLGCSVGGWAVAARGLPIKFVAVADIADDCLETWRLNHGATHPDCAVLNADLSTDAGRRTLYDAVGEQCPDLVLGGIPCEEISTSRQNNPVTSEVLAAWHRLVDGFFAIVHTYRPPWWSIEDVIQVERHLPGALFFGRDIPIRRIQASRFGPQRRLRTFIGRFPRELSAEPGPRTLGEVLRRGPYRTFSGSNEKKRSKRQFYSKDKIRVWDQGEPGYTVTSLHSRHSKGAMVETPIGPRHLEWQEAALLQGFPEDFLFVGGQTRVSKMVAQAISIHVGRAILRAVCHESSKVGQRVYS